VNDSQKLDNSDIEGLVKASQSRDRGAFDELVRLYQNRAMSVAVRILGRSGEAAEAAQDAFVKTYLSIDKLKEPKQFEIWLLRIVANAAIDRRRVASRRLEKIKITDCNVEDKNAVSPIDKEIRKELRDAIAAAMLKLSKKEAKAIALFGFEDLSHKEVAQIIDCSAGAAKWYVFRARQKLKVLLKDYL